MHLPYRYDESTQRYVITAGPQQLAVPRPTIDQLAAGWAGRGTAPVAEAIFAAWCQASRPQPRDRPAAAVSQALPAVAQRRAVPRWRRRKGTAPRGAQFDRTKVGRTTAF